jgi:hypothetical protein
MQRRTNSPLVGVRSIEFRLRFTELFIARTSKLFYPKEMQKGDPKQVQEKVSI